MDPEWIFQPGTVLLASRADEDAIDEENTRIGGGWGQYRFFEVSASMSWSRAYGLNKDGVPTRWIVSSGRFTSPASVAGFGDVKAMALISQTST